MKVKLTKEEFIKRITNGEVLVLDGYKYFYDEKEKNPFRIQEVGMNGDKYFYDEKEISSFIIDEIGIDESWGDTDGLNEFTAIESKQKTKIVEEWMYVDYSTYKPTGREFEVPDE